MSHHVNLNKKLGSSGPENYFFLNDHCYIMFFFLLSNNILKKKKFSQNVRYAIKEQPEYSGLCTDIRAVLLNSQVIEWLLRTTFCARALFYNN